ncbi:hypothetical protein HMN09_01104400 [Mycena chlorophos]|uniref:DNA mismatch repair protein MutL n=1 Tax=Mycena chlorophos TaxID=658473 RepID=A0A8H6VZT7_MYCCL|nr:hypothetical protein HMN09_01104400 [Mycena chlorophos]
MSDPTIRAIDKSSIHRITSAQVAVELQTAVKELIENSLDAGATVLEVRFKNHGLTSIEVVDNGSGIAEEDWDALAMKHHTSKLSTFADLDTVQTFGFRGEALSSLCAVCESVSVATATKDKAPVGVTLELESSGKVKSRGKVARQRGTTITLNKLFAPLPVRRKELERNAKREFGKALALLQGYALGPCARNGVRMTVSNQPDKGAKSVQLRTPGTHSLRDAVTAVWGPRALDNIVDLDVSFVVQRDKHAVRRLSTSNTSASTKPISVSLRGLVSAFAPNSGRAGPDRQFFSVNGRPCLLPKVQKTLTEVYKTFNAPGSQAPVVVADLVLPTDTYDVNVTPDKRTILLHHEAGLVEALKAALEETFAPARSTFGVSGPQTQTPKTKLDTKTKPANDRSSNKTGKSREEAIVLRDDDEDVAEDNKERGDDSDTDQSVDPRLDEPSGSGLLPPKTAATTSNINNIDRTLNNSSSTNDSPFLRPISAVVSTSSRAGTMSTTIVASSRKPSSTKLMAAKSTGIQTKLPFASTSAGADKVSGRVVVAAVGGSALAGSSKDVVAVTDDDDDVVSEDKTIHEPIPHHPDDSHDDDQDPSMIVDASQTSWGRKLKLGSKTKRGNTSGSGSGSEPDEQGRDEEPPLKRRKSEGRPGADDDEAEDMAVDARDDDARRIPASQKPSKATQSLRDTLAGFAGPGPRVISSQKPPLFYPEEEEEVDELDSDACMEMELDPDADADNEELVETQVINDESGPSSHTTVALVIDLSLDSDSDDPIDTSLPSASPISNNPPIARPEVIRTLDADGGGEMVLRVDVEKISRKWAALRAERDPHIEQAKEADAEEHHEALKDAGLAVEQHVADIDLAAQALSRTISKSDFAEMEVLGQFNLGFIVVRRRIPGSGMDDMFIVDQHAADEKYNFETLQQTTTIRSQKLFRPQPLELTAADELLALEKIEVLRQNGFEVEVQTEPATAITSQVDSDSEDTVDTSATTPRLALTAQPVSKDTVFDMKDLEELIHRMRDTPTGVTPRCTKARAMFAMRACRKSVMIGMSLTKSRMTAVVRNMGTMEQPWNCPHGRPTMRHLVDMLPIAKAVEKKRLGKRVDWGAFA